MALIVQNDLGDVAGANSYVTVIEFQDYWTARGVDYTTKTDEEIEAYLIPALSYLDGRYKYDGYKLNGRAQTTEFPRSALYDCSGGEYELVEGVPYEIKDAQKEYAHIQAEQGTLQPNGNINGSVKRTHEVVGPIEEEIEYFSSGQNGSVVSYPQADNKIPDCFKSCANSSSMARHT